MLAQNYRFRVSVRVPRGAAGDVAGGLCEVVEKVDDVAAAEVDELQGVHPDALDLYVDATVDVAFDSCVAVPTECLEDGFGVLDAVVE